MHYDEHENLHAVVRGSKRFTLFHPSDGKDVLEDGHKMRSLHYLWRWSEDDGRGYMHALNPLLSTPAHRPFSPVRLHAADVAKRHPRMADARRLVCDVGEGDTLFLPSFWWHHVEAQGENGRCPMTASVNYFFTPFYRKGSDLVHFAHEPFYEYLHGLGDNEQLVHRQRWRQGGADQGLATPISKESRE